MENARVPSTGRVDTVRLAHTCLAPDTIGEVLEALKSEPGLEGMVHVAPEEAGAVTYEVAVDVDLPSMKGRPDSQYGKNVPVASIILIEHRYVVRKRFNPGDFEYDPEDKKAATAAAVRVNAIIDRYAAQSSKQSP
jgi:hypothetical protein